jgi:outer membrane immunogenic protein
MMKNSVLAGLGLLAITSIVSTASAADLPRRPSLPVKAPAYVAPYYNWTGLYAGINGGSGFGQSRWSNAFGSTGDFDVSGGLAGGTIGYNWQTNQVVFGLEGDLDWSGIRGSANSPVCAVGNCNTRNNYLATVRGRIGYAFDRIMPYLTGGLAVGDIEAASNGVSSTETKAGWTLGGGIEFAVNGPWTAKVEYLYTDLGTASCSAGVCGAAATDVDFTANVVRGGLNYRF